MTDGRSSRNACHPLDCPSGGTHHAGVLRFGVLANAPQEKKRAQILEVSDGRTLILDKEEHCILMP
jgi:hypothetical protein